ncbi:hypothetical protein OG338_16755 [Streptomyces sp. NBC_00726]|uniref:hypothetical protein n=1 Tax=Streptomyces sp. NBC_00726 TaxID=2903674 RepID=UPI0038651D33
MTLLMVRQVVRDVVSEVAPEELPLLDGVLGLLDDAGVQRALTRRSRGREPLGFGLETVVALVVPVVWGALAEVARQTLQGAAQGGITRLRRRLGRSTAATEPLALPPLDREQILHVRRTVLVRCAAAGMDEARAVTVADSVAARLSLGELPDTPETQPEAGPAA